MESDFHLGVDREGRVGLNRDRAIEDVRAPASRAVLVRPDVSANMGLCPLNRGEQQKDDEAEDNGGQRMRLRPHEFLPERTHGRHN